MADIDELFDAFDEPAPFETALPANPVVTKDDEQITNGDGDG